jgi:hypothetical protein
MKARARAVAQILLFEPVASLVAKLLTLQTCYRCSYTTTRNLLVRMQSLLYLIA